MEWIVNGTRIVVFALMVAAVLECLIGDEDMSGGLRMIMALSAAAAVVNSIGKAL